MIIRKLCGAVRHGSSRLARAAILAALAVVCRCAHQVAPGGGPVDTTPPGAVVTHPQQGATLVDPGTEISLTFNEWISGQKAYSSVALFPPPPGGYTVRVKGKKLLIRPRGRFDDSTTYHVSVTSSLADLRNNALGAPFHLIFSTGPTLDSGTVSGCVIDPAKRILRPKVMLLRTDSVPPDSSYLGAPTYLAQTDSGGVFAFEHVRPGSYAIFAFDDLNGDNSLQPSREQAYTAVERVITVGKKPSRVILYPSASDTSTRRLTKCSALSDRIVSCSWSRDAFGRDRGRPSPVLRIVSADSTRHSPAVTTTVVRADGAGVLLLLAQPLRNAPYQVHYELQPALVLPDTISLVDSVRFNGTTRPDTARPRLLSQLSYARADLLMPVRLVWSEPVKLTGGRLLLADTLGDSVALSFDTSYADTTVCTPKRRLRPGRRYSLAIAPGDIRDLSGLHPADTVAVTVTVATVVADSLCYLLAGGAECIEPDQRRVWIFTPLGGGRALRSEDRRGHFRFDSIPGARGTLAWFSDRNNDGVWQAGEVFPWNPPEPWVPLYDTLEARANWDVENVPVKGCDVCERGQRLPVTAAPPVKGKAAGK